MADDSCMYPQQWTTPLCYATQCTVPFRPAASLCSRKSQGAWGLLRQQPTDYSLLTMSQYEKGESMWV
jgi:hypothetical protein